MLFMDSMEGASSALQGARDHIGRAQQRASSLRASLQQATLDARIPDAGLIVTPALVETLSKTREVQACKSSNMICLFCPPWAVTRAANAAAV